MVGEVDVVGIACADLNVGFLGVVHVHEEAWYRSSVSWYLTDQVWQHTMNCAVDRTGLRNGPYTGIKYIIIARNQLTCFQRICGLATRDNHLHGLAGSEYYIARVENMRVRSIRSRTDLIGAGDQFVRKGVHCSKVESEMGAKGTHALNLILTAIEGPIRRSCRHNNSSNSGQEEEVEEVPGRRHGVRS